MYNVVMLKRQRKVSVCVCVCVCVCVRERERERERERVREGGRERATHMFNNSTRQRHVGSTENISCIWWFAEVVM